MFKMKCEGMKGGKSTKKGGKGKPSKPKGY